jgi:hypothetical protein
MKHSVTRSPIELLSNPAHIAVTSVCLIGVVLLASVFPAMDLTIQDVEAVATPAIVMCFAYMVLSAVFVHRTVIHTYVLFLGCTSLFIGGRFIARSLGFDVVTFLGQETNIFAVNRPGFVTLSMSPVEALDFSRFIITCLLSIHAGYMVAMVNLLKKQPNHSTVDITFTLRCAAILLAVVSVALFAWGYGDVYAGVMKVGYLSQYQGSIDYTLRATRVAQYGLLLAMGLAFASRTRWLEILVYVLLAIYFVGDLALGIRGGIMGFALLTFWLFHMRVRPIRWGAIVMVPVVLVGLLLVADLGVRNPQFGDRGGFHVYLLWFMDTQGLSAIYAQSALRIDNYPALAYLHSLVPVVPIIAKALDVSVPPEQLYFSHYLSKSILAGYSQGQNVGWSLLADFRVYTFSIPGLYALAAGLFGWIFGRFACSTHPLVMGAHCMLFIKIMLLARTGLYSILPYLIAYGAIITACYLIAFVYNKRILMIMKD